MTRTEGEERPEPVARSRRAAQSSVRLRRSNLVCARARVFASPIASRHFEILGVKESGVIDRRALLERTASPVAIESCISEEIGRKIEWVSTKRRSCRISIPLCVAHRYTRRFVKVNERVFEGFSSKFYSSRTGFVTSCRIVSAITIRRNIPVTTAIEFLRNCRYVCACVRLYFCDVFLLWIFFVLLEVYFVLILIKSVTSDCSTVFFSYKQFSSKMTIIAF